MFPDTKEEVQGWVSAIAAGIPGPNSTSHASGEVNGAPSTTSSTPAASSPPSSSHETKKADANTSPRARLALAKGSVKFLQDEDSKVLEFWQIWSDSIPLRDDLASGMVIDFTVAISADMQKLTWRTGGPQNIFIQKMVDFFWNVGAPESEIDRLNDVGALINPVKIGSWIDMSAKGGMDGGWFFPVEIPVKYALESSDSGEAVNKFTEWIERHNVTTAFTVGRDMGAAPPRQTETRLRIPGTDADEQLRIALDAFSSFGFPPIPSDALTILKSMKAVGLALSVITSSEGFVRLGLLVPKPTRENVHAMIDIAGGNKQDLADLEGSLGTEGPSWAEYQYLMKGFGYLVYKEGFDIVFHYSVGEEVAE